MPFTNADWLPTYEELDVPDVGLSSAPLRAGAHHFGKYCDKQCKCIHTTCCRLYTFFLGLPTANSAKVYKVLSQGADNLTQVFVTFPKPVIAAIHRKCGHHPVYITGELHFFSSTEEKDPRKCIKEGKDVTLCGLEFFQKVKKHCAEEFTQYWKCVDTARDTMELRRCRATQAGFDKCIFNNLGQERPGLGYFSKVRVHHTNRPKPQRDIKLPEPNPEPPKFDPKEPVPESAKYGTRFLF